MDLQDDFAKSRDAHRRSTSERSRQRQPWRPWPIIALARWRHQGQPLVSNEPRPHHLREMSGPKAGRARLYQTASRPSTPAHAPPRRSQMSPGSTRGPRHTPGIPCGRTPALCPQHRCHACGMGARSTRVAQPPSIKTHSCHDGRNAHGRDIGQTCASDVGLDQHGPSSNRSRITAVGARQHGKPSTSARHGDQGSQLRITSPPQKCWGWWPQGNCTSSTKRVGRTDYTVDTATCATGVWFHGMLTAQTPQTEHGAVWQCTCRETSRTPSQ